MKMVPREVILARKREWRLANPDAVKESKRAHYVKYRDQILAESKARRWADIDRRRAMARARYSANRDEILEQQKCRYQADPESFLRGNRKRRADNLDKFRERDKAYAKAHQQRDKDRFLAKARRANHKRKALLLGAFIEAVEPSAVFARDNGVCGICGFKIPVASKWHLDHIVPLSRGGAHCYENVQVAHVRCNLSKRANLPIGQIGLFQVISGGR